MAVPDSSGHLVRTLLGGCPILHPYLLSTWKSPKSPRLALPMPLGRHQPAGLGIPSNLALSHCSCWVHVQAAMVRGRWGRRLGKQISGGTSGQLQLPWECRVLFLGCSHGPQRLRLHSFWVRARRLSWSHCHSLSETLSLSSPTEAQQSLTGSNPIPAWQGQCPPWSLALPKHHDFSSDASETWHTTRLYLGL